MWISAKTVRGLSHGTYIRDGSSEHAANVRSSQNMFGPGFQNSVE